MPLKILLTADVHLGLKFAGYPQVQKELAEARFETLRKTVTLANESQCDIFAVAGDLFDHLRLPDRDIILAAQIISQFQGRLAIVLPGNHDFIVPGESKVWPKFKSNAGDRVLLLEECKTYSLKHYDLDANMYAGPCDAKHSKVNHVGWLKDEPKDPSVKYHIGLAHGSLQGVSPDPDQSYYPMTEDELLKYGLDLW
ncbi:DNA repair exonuclease, partial [bacterium]